MRALTLMLFLTLSSCGFRENDPELEPALAWSRDFKAENPELARELGQLCKTEIGQSPWTRDGSLALFQCIRRKAEARDY